MPEGLRPQSPPSTVSLPHSAPTHLSSPVFLFLRSALGTVRKLGKIQGQGSDRRTWQVWGIPGEFQSVFRVLRSSLPSSPHHPSVSQDTVGP